MFIPKKAATFPEAQSVLYNTRHSPDKASLTVCSTLLTINFLS